MSARRGHFDVTKPVGVASLTVLSVWFLSKPKVSMSDKLEFVVGQTNQSLSDILWPMPKAGNSPPLNKQSVATQEKVMRKVYPLVTLLLVFVFGSLAFGR